MKAIKTSTLIASFFLTVSSFVDAAPNYTIIDLGVIQTYSGNIAVTPNTTPTGINNNGEVIGSAFHATDCCNSGGSGFYWSSATGIVQLQQPTANRNYYASAINDQGTIVGIDDATGEMITWQNGIITQRTNISQNNAIDINNSGSILLSNGSLLSNGAITQLGTLNSGLQLNNNGQVIGGISGDDRHNYLWNNGVQSIIGDPNWKDGYASSINDLGQIVGSYGFSYHTYTECDWSCIEYETISSMHAFIFQDGAWIDLGEGYATANNNKGEIIGYTFNGFMPVYFDSEGGAILLSQLITNPELFSSLSRVTAINDNGQIVGYGQLASNGEYHAFLLNPVPLPSGIWLLGSALSGLIAFSRKKHT